MTQIKKGIQFPVDSLASVSGMLSMQANGTLDTLTPVLEHVFQDAQVKRHENGISIRQGDDVADISLSDETSSGKISLYVRSDSAALAKSVSDGIATSWMDRLMMRQIRS